MRLMISLLHGREPNAPRKVYILQQAHKMTSNGTRCDNALADRMKLSLLQSTTIAVIVVILGLVIGLSNAILAYAMHKCKLLKTRSNYYLFLLTTTDGLYSVFVMPLFVLLFTRFRRERHCSLELATCFTGQCIFNTSTYLITLIAFHRYLKIDPSMKNLSYTGLKHSAMSGRIANVLVLGCFILPVLHGIISTPFLGRNAFSVANAVIKGINAIVFITICCLYVNLYYRFARKRDKILDSKGEKKGSMTLHGKSRSRQKDLMATVLLILASLFVTVLPYFITDVWTSWNVYISKQPIPLELYFSYYLCLMTISINCIANALIVIYRNRPVKEFLRGKLKMIRASKTPKHHDMNQDEKQP